MVIWVSMFKRPEITTSDDDYLKAVNFRSIFNYILEENLVSQHYMYIMSIEDLLEEPVNFKPNGKLSDMGMEDFWRELDYKMRKFNRRELDLKPISKKDPPKVIPAFPERPFLPPPPGH